MSGKLSFLPGEISLATNGVVTTNSEKSADAIVGERCSLKGRTIYRVSTPRVRKGRTPNVLRVKVWAYLKGQTKMELSLTTREERRNECEPFRTDSK